MWLWELLWASARMKNPEFVDWRYAHQRSFKHRNFKVHQSQLRKPCKPTETNQEPVLVSRFLVSSRKPRNVRKPLETGKSTDFFSIESWCSRKEGRGATEEEQIWGAEMIQAGMMGSRHLNDKTRLGRQLLIIWSWLSWESGTGDAILNLSTTTWVVAIWLFFPCSYCPQQYLLWPLTQCEHLYASSTTLLIYCL